MPLARLMMLIALSLAQSTASLVACAQSGNSFGTIAKRDEPGNQRNAPFATRLNRPAVSKDAASEHTRALIAAHRGIVSELAASVMPVHSIYVAAAAHIASDGGEMSAIENGAEDDDVTPPHGMFTDTH